MDGAVGLQIGRRSDSWDLLRHLPHFTLPLSSTPVSSLPSLMSFIYMPPSPRPDIPDVHTLVALAANRLSPDRLHFTSCHWRSRIPDTPLILDAIAEICVTEKYPQPAAVALTIDTRLRQVRLLITQGGVTQPDECLLSRIRQTWGLLREVSDRALKRRRRSLGQACLATAEQGLYRYIYLVKRVEVIRDIHEWWPMLDAADRQFGRSVRSLGGKVLQCSPMSLFQHASLALRKAVRIMGEDLSPLTPESWQQVMSLMEIASGHYSTLAGQWEMCERWGTSFKGICGTCHLPICSSAKPHWQKRGNPNPPGLGAPS